MMGPGIISATEQMDKEEIARLLVYESSSRPAGERIGLSEYIKAMPDTQQDIYYLAAPSRELAEQSPYFESLKVGCDNMTGAGGLVWMHPLVNATTFIWCS